MTWINEINNPKPEEITSIRFTAKGAIINCPNYSCFIWKSDSLCTHLAEALSYFSAAGTGLTLVVYPDKTEKRGFSVIPTKDKATQEWFFNPSKDEYSGKEENYENPFLSLPTQTTNPLLPFPGGVGDTSSVQGTDPTPQRGKKRV